MYRYLKAYKDHYITLYLSSGVVIEGMLLELDKADNSIVIGTHDKPPKFMNINQIVYFTRKIE